MKTKKDYSKEDVDEFMRRGNKILRKFRIIDELNAMGIRPDDQPRKYTELAEISAAFGLVEKKMQDISDKEITEAGDKMKWL